MARVLAATILLAASWAVVLAQVAAEAASLTVSPLRLDLSPREQRGVFNLRNSEDQPVRMQARGFLWTQVDGQSRLVDSGDLIVVPPVFTIPPQGKQVVRVGFRRLPPLAANELSYRVILSQAPGASGEGKAIAVALSLSLPVFLSPPNTRPIPQWSASASGPRALRLALHNAGTAHMRLSELAVLPTTGGAPLGAVSSPAYVLPGATREWTIPLDRPLGGGSVKVLAKTATGDLEADVSVGP